MRLRAGAFVLVVSVLAAGCGSRESGPPPGLEVAAAGVPAAQSGAAPAQATVGALKPGCGKNKPARGATEKGVTDTTITVGVISDKSGVVAVPTAGIDGSVEAFVQFCNSLGGINGRRLVLKHLRDNLTQVINVMHKQNK